MSKEATFERFAAAVGGTNPFRSTRVTDPGSPGEDVAEINGAAFTKLTRAVDAVGRESLATGLLLLGAAGVGKSHLLARLFQWAAEDRATVVYLQNILASPERMYRYLLHATVSNLANHHGAFAESRLYGVLTRALRHEAIANGIKTPRGEDADRAMPEVARRIDPRGRVGAVLSTFRSAASSRYAADPQQHARARAAILWLSGEVIDGDDAELLNLRGSEDELCLPDDAAVDEVLRALANLCAEAQRPLVLCLDQVDNLDAPAVTSLCASMQALLDRAKNLLVVTSGVKESLLRFKNDGIIAQAAWDRLAERTIELTKVSADEAQTIVARRLDRFMSVFKEVPQVSEAAGIDPLFPLGREWLRGRLGETPEFRPRDVVTYARDRWEQQQEALIDLGAERWIREWQATNRPTTSQATPLDQLIDSEVDLKLKEAFNRRKLAQADLPPDDDNLANLAARLLGHCAADSRYTLLSVERTKPNRKATTYQLLATERRSDGVDVRNGVTFITSASGQGTWRALGRILDDPSPPTHRILVTDEERRPLKLGKVGEDTYQKLIHLGEGAFLHVKLTFDAYAQLDAMASVLGAARGGDLEVEFPRRVQRPISEIEAAQALHRSGTFLGHPLLRELLTEDAPPTSEAATPVSAYDKDRAAQHIMAELSWRLGMMTRELAITFRAREQLDMEIDAVWARLKEMARALHEAGKIYAAAQDDDLFLQMRKKRT